MKWVEVVEMQYSQELYPHLPDRICNQGRRLFPFDLLKREHRPQEFPLLRLCFSEKPLLS